MIRVTELKTVAFAARRFDVSVPRLYRLIREGVIPAGVVVRQGRRLKINAVRLDDFINKGGASYPGGWRRKGKPR